MDGENLSQNYNEDGGVETDLCTDMNFFFGVSTQHNEEFISSVSQKVLP